MVDVTVKEVTNAVDGQDADHAGGTDWNQTVQILKGTHATERIQSKSIQTTAWVTKTAASQTLDTDEQYVLADASSNNVTITLPTAVGCLTGKFVIKRIDVAYVYTVTIATTGGQTIDGKTSVILYHRDKTITFVSDGANWKVEDGIEVAWNNFRCRGATLNRWYTSELLVNTASVTATVVAGNMYAFPVTLTKTVTIDQVAVSVTTLGAGSNVYAAIYADDGNLYPSALIADLGGQSSATTGVKTFTANLPITLLAGLYWLVFNCSATAPIVSGFAIIQLRPILGTTNALTAALGVGWTVAQAAGAFPNPFTASGTAIIAAPLPAIFFRISG